MSFNTSKDTPQKKMIKPGYMIIGIIAAVVIITAAFVVIGQRTDQTSTYNLAKPMQESDVVADEYPSEEIVSLDEQKSKSDALTRMLNIAGILIVAIITSAGTYIYYRVKLAQIKTFPVIISDEESQ